MARAASAAGRRGRREALTWCRPCTPPSGRHPGAASAGGRSWAGPAPWRTGGDDGGSGARTHTPHAHTTRTYTRVHRSSSGRACVMRGWRWNSRECVRARCLRALCPGPCGRPGTWPREPPRGRLVTRMLQTSGRRADRAHSLLPSVPETHTPPRPRAHAVLPSETRENAGRCQRPPHTAASPELGPGSLCPPLARVFSEISTQSQGICVFLPQTQPGPRGPDMARGRSTAWPPAAGTFLRSAARL